MSISIGINWGIRVEWVRFRGRERATIIVKADFLDYILKRKEICEKILWVRLKLGKRSGSL